MDWSENAVAEPFAAALEEALERSASAEAALARRDTALAGARAELQAARQLFSTTRLLTLTGSPGAGKTRLGLRLAADALAEFPDDVADSPRRTR